MSDQKDTNTQRKPDDKRWRDWVEEKIQQAQEAGLFDDLPGRGKPLPQRGNPFAPRDRALAYDLLHDSGHTLPWIEEGQEIERRYQRACQRRRHHYAWYRARRENADDVEALEEVWRQHVATFAEELSAINRQIDLYNLKAPSSLFHKMHRVLAEELAKLEEA